MMTIKEWRLISKLNKGNNALVSSEVSLINERVRTDRDVNFGDITDRYFLDANGIFNLSFDKVSKLKFVNSKIKSLGSNEQRICDTLRFDQCGYLKILDMHNVDFYDSVTSGEYANLLIDECYQLTEINNIRSSQLALRVTFNAGGLSRIHFADPLQNVDGLTLYRQQNFSDLWQIRNGDIFILKLYECAIRRFTRHNALKISHCTLDCSKIVSFRDIQNFKINESLQLNNISVPHNMINVLLNTCKMITIEGVLPLYQVSGLIPHAVAKNIISRFASRKNRSEYMMDCVIELLEENCEVAAEL